MFNIIHLKLSKEIVRLSLVDNNVSQNQVFVKFKIIFHFMQLLGVLYNQNCNSVKLTKQEDLYFIQLFSYTSFEFDNSVQSKILLGSIICHILLFIVIAANYIFKVNFLKSVTAFTLAQYVWILAIPFQNQCFNNEIVREQFNIHQAQLIYSVILTIIVFITSLISIYYFRNIGLQSQHGNPGLNSRSFSVIVLQQVLVLNNKFCTTNSNYVQLLILFVLLTLRCYDVRMSNVFNNNLGILYVKGICITMSADFILVLHYLNLIKPGFIFFSALISIPIINQLSILLYSNLNPVEYCNPIIEQQFMSWDIYIPQKFKQFVYFLEELEYQAMQCITNRSAQMQAIILILKHCQDCRNTICICQQSTLTFFDSQKNIEKTQIICFIKQQLEMLASTSYKIHYIQYLLEHRQNSYSNYVQFISLQNQTKVDTIYEICVLNLFQKQIVNTINDDFLRTGSKEDLRNIFTLRLLQVNESRLYDCLNSIINAKLSFWQKICENQITSLQQLSGCLENIVMLILKCKQIKKDIKEQTNNQLGNQAQDYSVLFLKLSILIKSISYNSLKQILEINRQIDQLLNQEKITTSVVKSSYFSMEIATQVVAVISKQDQGAITSISNEFGNLSRINNINDLMPTAFSKIHSLILDKYCRQGPNRYGFFDIFIQSDQKYVERVQVHLSLLFLKSMQQGQLTSVATITKLDEQSTTAHILLDRNFRILCQTYNLSTIIPNSLNTSIFQLLPMAYTQLFNYFNNCLNKQIIFQNEQSICILTEDLLIVNKQLSTCNTSHQIQIPDEMKQLNEQQLPFSHQERLEYLMQLQEKQYITTEDCETYNVRYTITQKVVDYLEEEELKQFLYYQIQIEFDSSIFTNNQETRNNQYTNAQFHTGLPLQLQKETLIRYEKNSESSGTSGINIIDQVHHFHRSANSKLLSKGFYYFLGLSALLYFVLVSAIVLIGLMLEWKKQLQSNCFSELSYSTQFLDSYSEAIIGSRHVIYMRDFNQFLKPYNYYEGQVSTPINITSYDKIDFSLHIYKYSILAMIDHYQSNLDQLNIYQQNNQIVELILINQTHNKTEIQMIESQAEYYQVMVQTLYMAIKSFAKDPSLYFQGKTDTYAQTHTRSIIYLNFRRVAALTLELMVQCQQNNSDDNLIMDLNYLYILAMYYICFTLLFMGVVILQVMLAKKRKMIYKVFKVVSIEQNNEEQNRLQAIQQYLLSSHVWISELDFQQLKKNDSNKVSQRDVSSKQVRKSKQQQNQKYIQSYLSCKTQSLLVLSLICLTFANLMFFQIRYNYYSESLKPIVSAALQTLYIRLEFINTIHDWDAYINLKFYGAYLDIQKSYPANTKFQFQSKNIINGHKLLSFIHINETELIQRVNDLQSEPFTNLMYNDKIEMDETIQEQYNTILTGDMCSLDIFQCDMNNSVFKGRIYINELKDLYQVGIINLYKSTSQIMIQNDFFNTTDPFQIIEKFETLEESLDYFIYFLWGFDATIYQIRLFSDYFVILSEQILMSLTEQLQNEVIIIGSIQLICVLMTLIYFNKLSFDQQLKARKSLKLIPYSTILANNLSRTLKTIDTNFL